MYKRALKLKVNQIIERKKKKLNKNKNILEPNLMKCKSINKIK